MRELCHFLVTKRSTMTDEEVLTAMFFHGDQFYVTKTVTIALLNFSNTPASTMTNEEGAAMASSLLVYGMIITVTRVIPIVVMMTRKLFSVCETVYV